MRKRNQISLAAGLVAALPVAAADPIGIVFPQVTLTSDYRYYGLSNSNNDPAVQASLYVWRPDNWYGGIWLTNVDFLAPGSPSYEVDLYVGRKFELDAAELSVEIMTSIFPDDDLPGSSLNFVQGTAKYERDFGRVKASSEASWSPEGSAGVGSAWRVQGGLDVELNDWLSVGALYGTFVAKRGQDRKYWEYGATAKTKMLEFDVRYIDTDIERPQCFFTEWCEPSVVGKVTLNVPIWGWKMVQ